MRSGNSSDVRLLTTLNEQRERDGLTEGEEVVVRESIRQCDRAVLIRSKALALLQQRGEDISTLVGGHASVR
jgi:hypothetical protein